MYLQLSKTADIFQRKFFYRTEIWCILSPVFIEISHLKLGSRRNRDDLMPARLTFSQLVQSSFKFRFLVGSFHHP